MHDKMMKMLMGKKKEGKTLSDSEKKSKLQALGGMRDMASQMMGDKLKNLKKVTVASNSQPGLKEGLHKAEDLISQNPQDDDQEPKDGSMYSEGGSVYDRGDKGGHVAKMPNEFDTDLDNVDKENDLDRDVRSFSDGGMAEGSDDSQGSDDQEYGDEQIDKIVNECPEDLSKIDELIQKLEAKKQSLEK